MCISNYAQMRTVVRQAHHERHTYLPFALSLSKGQHSF